MEARLARHELIDNMVQQLEKALPPVFARKDLPEYFGSSLNPKTLANLGKAGPPFIRRKKKCDGRGGASSERDGRHAIYCKETFLAWYRKYLGTTDSPSSV